jgi:AraC-like DNA-binding protein
VETVRARPYAAAEGRFSVTSRLVVRSRRYIRERYADPRLDLAAIAAYAEVSKNHLSWEFARETGENISTYIARVRVEAAKSLLATTALKTYEIAEKVGYVNVETFCPRLQENHWHHAARFSRSDRAPAAGTSVPSSINGKRVACTDPFGRLSVLRVRPAIHPDLSVP